jgi:uncharacterized protein
MNAARSSLVALLLCWAFAAFADVAVPPLTGRVVDQTGTLSGSDVASLQQTLMAFEQRKGSQVAVLIVPSTGPETIEQYSLRVAETWKIGRKKIDDGALLVVAKDDRKLRIEVGYGLEGALTDVTAKRIIDEIITPRFRSGDFAGGISAGIAGIIGVIDGEKLPAPVSAREPKQSRDPSLLSFLNPLNPFTIFGVLVVGTAMRKTAGRLIGSALTGGIAGLVAWLIAGSAAVTILAAIVVFGFALFTDLTLPQRPTPSQRRGRHGGWSGGGGSSSGGSGSSSSSDSGGGGGSFGGGGASGSW